MKKIIITFFLCYLSGSFLLKGQDIEEKRKQKLIEKGEYIIGNRYKLKLFDKADIDRHPFKDTFYRSFKLEYDFFIDFAAYDGNFVKALINKENYKEKLKEFANLDDPYKYVKLERKEFEQYLSYNDAEIFCGKRGGRIAKDYELEIALKYYKVPAGANYKGYNNNSDIGVFYEFAKDKDGNPIILKYFYGKIQGIMNDFIFIDEVIKIKNDEEIAASVRCVYNVNQ